MRSSNLRYALLMLVMTALCAFVEPKSGRSQANADVARASAKLQADKSFRIAFEGEPRSCYGDAMRYSMLFGWEFFSGRNTPMGINPLHNITPALYSESLEVHTSLCAFLSSCHIPHSASPSPSKLKLHPVSAEASVYFLALLRRTWEPTGLLGGFHYYHWLAMSNPDFIDNEKLLDDLIRQYEAFQTLFPKDRYLGAYARLGGVILRLYKNQRDTGLSEQFVDIEKKHSELPEIGIMASWWNAMSLALVNPAKAKEAFAHLATKYKKHGWKVVQVAAEASKGSTEKWIEMGLIPKPHARKR